MCDLKTKYVNSIQLYHLIYLSVKPHNCLKMAEMAFFRIPINQ
jgi:hypothetical protein